MGSATVREYPGLVVVPQPTPPLEVAEALVHEGAPVWRNLCLLGD